MRVSELFEATKVVRSGPDLSDPAQDRLIARALADKADKAVSKYDVRDLTSPIIKGEKPISKPDELVKLIESECSQMLLAYQRSGRVLWRGMRDAPRSGLNAIKTDIATVDARRRGLLEPNMAATAHIRPDRMPVEMGKSVHDALHRAFVELNIPATRKNSIFVSTRRDVALDWGLPYVIFVKNGWSGLVFDNSKGDYSFYPLEQFGKAYVQKAKRDMEAADKAFDELLNNIRTLEPRTFRGADGLERVLKEQYYEALISGSSYIAVTETLFKTLAPKLGIDLKEVE